MNPSTFTIVYHLNYKALAVAEHFGYLKLGLQSLAHPPSDTILDLRTFSLQYPDDKFHLIQLWQ